MLQRAHTEEMTGSEHLALLQRRISLKQKNALYKSDLSSYASEELSLAEKNELSVHESDTVNEDVTGEYYEGRSNMFDSIGEHGRYVALPRESDQCNYSASTLVQCKKLIKTVHSRDQCIGAFSLYNMLKRHAISVHTKQKPSECGQCNYTASTYSNLKIHITSVHNKERQFKCNNCKYKAKQHCKLKRHILSVHDKERLFKCEQCNYKAKRHCDLKRHILSVHDKERLFKCDQCYYAASKSGTLRRHIIGVHNKERPFKCDQCNYSA